MFLPYIRNKIIIKTLRDSALLTSFKRFSLSCNHLFLFVFIVNCKLYTIHCEHRTPSNTQWQMAGFSFIFFNIFYISCQYSKLTTVELKLLSLVLTPGRMFRAPSSESLCQKWESSTIRSGIFREKKRYEIFCCSDVLTQNNIMPVLEMWFIKI